MKSTFLKVLIAVAVCAFATLSNYAQPSEVPAARSGSLFAGETLKFEGKINKMKISISVAELSFTAALAPNATDLLIKGEAVSKGTLTKLFRFSFLQQYNSTIDLNGFRILKTTKHDVQKERVRDSEAIFDYGQKRVTYVETDPKDVNRPPRRIASEIGDQVYDISAAIYGMRLMPLAAGKRFEISISDSGVVYKVPVAVTGREEQNTVLGKVWCLRLEPEVFGPGRLIEKTGKMVIWMTDDDRHTPVRAQISAPIGRVDIKLKSATK